MLARERAAGRHVRFLYLVPNFQNPTGLLLSRAKRRLVLEWANREDVLIVEDDPYGALYFEDAATADDARPIKADDQDGRVIYLSSFSKTLAPGFRVAWVTAPETLIGKLEVFKQTADLLTPSLDQHVVYQAYRRGVLTARLPMLRKFYQDKRTVMQRALREELGTAVSWPEPRGGFFLWASLPEGCDTEAMLPRAIEQRVIYVAGQRVLRGRQRAQHHAPVVLAPRPGQDRRGRAAAGEGRQDGSLIT